MKEAILCQNPVPDNSDNVKKFDDCLREILKEKRKVNEQNIENFLEKLQRKTANVKGPLSELWNILEGEKGTEEDAVQISMNDLLHYIEQTLLLLGQSNYAITYHRRLNVLGSVMNFQYQVKSILKEKGATSPKAWQISMRKKVQEPYCWRYKIQKTNQRDLYRT